MSPQQAFWSTVLEYAFGYHATYRRQFADVLKSCPILRKICFTSSKDHDRDRSPSVLSCGVLIWFAQGYCEKNDWRTSECLSVRALERPSSLAKVRGDLKSLMCIAVRATSVLVGHVEAPRSPKSCWYVPRVRVRCQRGVCTVFQLLSYASVNRKYVPSH